MKHWFSGNLYPLSIQIPTKRSGPPTQDTKVEQVSSKQPQEVESVAEEPRKAPRKWWKLW
ncbi:hypothetical protein CUS80_13675 [Enterococcus faecium]|nr:hypothetical protein CUS80_13675 [Enterococcus faecium]ROX39051.1 hypothetical protein EGW25_12745 [Enterococcus faecium]